MQNVFFQVDSGRREKKTNDRNDTLGPKTAVRILWNRKPNNNNKMWNENMINCFLISFGRIYVV